MNKKLLTGLVLVPLISLGTVTGASAAQASTTKDATVKIGVVDASSPYWKVLTKEAKAKHIVIKLVNFSSYTQPNPALAQKQTDLNLFQHLQYLGTYNKSAKQNLTPIGATVVVPLGLYSKKYTSVKSIPAGSTIAVPNDPANLARGLNVLKSAGLVTFKGKPKQPTAASVNTSTSKVKIVTVDAAQTVAQLPSVAGSIINNNFVETAKIDPKSVLFEDNPKSPSAQPYINTFVSRAADKNNKTYLEIVKLWHTKAVEKAVLKESKGTAVIVTGFSNKKLATILKSVEKNIK